MGDDSLVLVPPVFPAKAGAAARRVRCDVDVEKRSCALEFGEEGRVELDWRPSAAPELLLLNHVRGRLQATIHSVEVSDGLAGPTGDIPAALEDVVQFLVGDGQDGHGHTNWNSEELSGPEGSLPGRMIIASYEDAHPGLRDASIRAARRGYAAAEETRLRRDSELRKQNEHRTNLAEVQLQHFRHQFYNENTLLHDLHDLQDEYPGNTNVVQLINRAKSFWTLLQFIVRGHTRSDVASYWPNDPATMVHTIRDWRVDEDMLQQVHVEVSGDPARITGAAPEWVIARSRLELDGRPRSMWVFLLLVNIVDNALKHGDGWPEREIWIRCMPSPDVEGQVRFEVENTGPEFDDSHKVMKVIQDKLQRDAAAAGGLMEREMGDARGMDLVGDAFVKLGIDSFEFKNTEDGFCIFVDVAADPSAARTRAYLAALKNQAGGEA